MKYHVRIPLKAKALTRIECEGECNIMALAERRISQGKFDYTCEDFDYDNAQISPVCVDCGTELIPEEAKSGVCEECYQKDQERIRQERKHPDEK